MPDTSDAVHRYVFPIESTAELAARLAKFGPSAQLRVKIENNEAFLKVFIAGSTAAAEEPDINHSHPCPPFTDCPG